MANKLLITIDGDASGLIKTLESTERRLNTFNTRISNSSRALTNMMKTLNGMNGSVRQVSAACEQISRALATATTRVNNFSSSVGRIRNSANQAVAGTRSLDLGVGKLVLTLYSVRALLFTGQSLFGGVVSSVIDANSQFEKMQVLLKNVSGGATDLQKVALGKADSNYIWNLADNAPFKVQALTESFVKLKAAGINPAAGSLKALVDTVAYFGGDSDQLKRAGLAISQMLSKGKVTAEELRQQLGDAIPNAMGDMAKAMNMTIPELDKAMKKGLVLSSEAVPKLMELWRLKYGGGAEAMMDTWDGLMSRMSNAWTRMIQRVTEEAGKGSFFETLKKQFKDLTTFMSSAKGDDFLKGFMDTSAKLVVMIADTIKWLYEYRDAIGTIIKVAAGFIALKVGANIILGVGSAIAGTAASVGSFVSGLRAAIAFAGAFTSSATAMNAIALITGDTFAIVASNMGIFTAAGKISLAMLATWTTVIGGAAAAVGFLAYAIYKNRQEKEADSVTVQKSNVLNRESKKVTDDLTKSIDAVNMATGQARIASEKDLVQRIAATKTKLEETKVNYMNAKSALAMAAAQAAVAEAKESASEQSTGWGIAGIGQRLGNEVTDFFGMSEKSKAKQNLANTKKTFTDLMQQMQNETDALNGAISSYQGFKIQDDVAAEAARAVAAKTGTPEKDKLGSLDAKRQGVLNTLMKINELDSQLGAKTEDDLKSKQEWFAEHRDQLENNLRAQVMAISSQKTLNDLDIASNKQLAIKKLAYKEMNEQIALREREEEGLKNLQIETTDQTIRAKDAIGQLDPTYNRVSAQVDRYVLALRKKHALELASGDDATKTQAEMAVEEAANEKRIELINLEAAKTLEASREITDSFMNESDLKERLYQQEVARIQNLLAENQKINGPEAIKTAEIYNNYLDNLAKKRKFDKSPFASWAKDASDLRGNLGDSLAGSMDGFVNSLMSGKAAFADFAKSLLADIAKIIIRGLIAKAIMSALGLGVSGGGSIDPSSMQIGGVYQSAFDVPVKHTGGKVGVAGGISRSVDPGMFAFAQRYHGGGFPGLGPNEVPIIAEKGEGVFTEEQMKAMGSKSNSGMGETQVNIINQTGVQADAQASQPRFDGEKYVIDIVMKNMSRPGPMRDSMKGMK